MPRWLVIAFLSAVTLGCKTPPAKPPEGQTGPNDPTASTDPDPDPQADGKSRKPPRCAADGRPWDGRPTGCLYEHGRCCYDAPEAACAAAGCPGAGCQVLESSPAQILCRKKATKTGP